MPNPNLDLLMLMAQQLRPLLSEIVFVGGYATGLLVDDPGILESHPCAAPTMSM